MDDMSGFKYSQLKLCSPCYDPKTKTDCERRCTGCQVSCPDWAKYAKQREAERERNIKKSADETRYTSYVTDRAKRIKNSVKRKK